MTIECLQCGIKTKVENYDEDTLGEYVNCSVCGGSFDIDKEQLEVLKNKMNDRATKLYHLMFNSTDKEVIMAVAMWLNIDISIEQSCELSKKFNNNFTKIVNDDFYKELFSDEYCKDEEEIDFNLRNGVDYSFKIKEQEVNITIWRS